MIKSAKKSLDEELHDAVIGDEYSQILTLIKNGAKVDFRDGSLTPLMTAAHLNHDFAARALLSSGADLSLTNWSGQSALDMAWASQATKTFCTIAEAQIMRNKGPIWMTCQRGDVSLPMATRVSNVLGVGVLCEHFDFADKMCTSLLFRKNETSLSRYSFNTVARHLVEEARKHTPGLPKPRSPKYKLAEL